MGARGERKENKKIIFHVPQQKESCDQLQPFLLIYHQHVWGREKEELQKSSIF
jgi:hypothetical protein